MGLKWCVFGVVWVWSGVGLEWCSGVEGCVFGVVWKKSIFKIFINKCKSEAVVL